MHIAAMLILTMAPWMSMASDEAPGNKPGWFKRAFGNLSWNEIQLVVDTPREASAAVRQNIRYAEDLGDTWTGGEETWNRGSGDCEDMAAAVVEMVHKVGGEASIVVFRPENSGAGHAVAIGTWQGRQWVSSNGFYYSVKSLDQAKTLVAREMGWRHGLIVAEPVDTARMANTTVASRQPSSVRIMLP